MRPSGRASRVLSSSSVSLGSHLDTLGQFTSLQKLELDFTSDGLSTQTSRSLLIFKNIVVNLTVLQLTSLPRIDVVLLATIASRFSSLTALELSCTERLDKTCCWLCYEESSSCTIHSPIPDMYPSVEHLAVRPCISPTLSRADVINRYASVGRTPSDARCSLSGNFDAYSWASTSLTRTSSTATLTAARPCWWPRRAQAASTQRLRSGRTNASSARPRTREQCGSGSGSAARCWPS